MNRKIAVFDIDGTLIKGHIQQGLINFFYKKRQLRLSYVLRLNIWFILYKMGLVSDMKKVFEYGLSYLKERSTDDIGRLIDEYIETCVSVNIFPKSRSLIEKLKSEGYMIIFLSTAVDAIVSKIAVIFGADDFICTRLEAIDGKYTGKINGEICYGENKKEKLERYLESKSLSLSWAEAYADHESDIPVLKSVGKGYIVNPDTHMRDIAARERLDIIETR